MYSGGMPCVTPGTPPGKTSLRSPGSFFFSFRPNMSSLSGSKFEQAVSAGADVARTGEQHDAINCSHALAPQLLPSAGDQSRQNFRTRARARRRILHRPRSCRDIAGQQQDRDCARQTTPEARARYDGSYVTARQPHQAACACRQATAYPPAACRRARRRDPARSAPTEASAEISS